MKSVCTILISLLAALLAHGSPSENLRLYLTEVFESPLDRQSIELLLGSLASLPDRHVDGGLTIRGPDNAEFYFENLNRLSGFLAKPRPEAAPEDRQGLEQIELLLPSNNRIDIQPSRIKEIRWHYYSPVNGRRIASFRVHAITARHRSVGPFKIPVPGYQMEGAELTLSRP